MGARSRILHVQASQTGRPKNRNRSLSPSSAYWCFSCTYSPLSQPLYTKICCIAAMQIIAFLQRGCWLRARSASFFQSLLPGYTSLYKAPSTSSLGAFAFACQAQASVAACGCYLISRTPRTSASRHVDYRIADSVDRSPSTLDRKAVS